MVRRRQVLATVDGMTFLFDLGETIDLAFYLQQFEPEVVAAIDHHCRKGMVVFDIGANIGAHTLRFARNVGAEGCVYAFEPTDFAFKKLQKNLSLNAFPHAKAVHVALSDRNLPDQQIDFRASWRTDGARADGTSRVDFCRLDDWCGQNGVDRVDLIKIDVDGNEFPILTGGRDVLERNRPLLLMEVVGPHFENPEANPFKFLWDLGYEFRDLVSGKQYRSLEEMQAPLPSGDFGMTVSYNVIASPGLPKNF